MEVFLYNSTVCRLCGEENDNGSLLYSTEDNNQLLCDIINTYLPIKVSDDGVLPRTICPGCTIQLEATTEFINLIINGQKVLRELHQREKDYKKTLEANNTTEEVTENIVYEVNTADGVYETEHPIALQVAGLEKPRRKRGRPPKKSKSPEELALEAASKEKEQRVKNEIKNEDPGGKRRRKAPTRFKEAVQGKELERIFLEEGVIDDEESEPEAIIEPEPKSKEPPKEPEVIGHMASSGELVVVTKGKGRGRPKGRMRPTREDCAICGMTFSCVGRYMSHVASHGPVLYQCSACSHTFRTRLQFNTHQRDTGHTGQNVMPCTTEQPLTDSEIVIRDGELTQPQNQETQEQNLSTTDPLHDTQRLQAQGPRAPQSLPDLSEPIKAEVKEENSLELHSDKPELTNHNESTSPIDNSEIAIDESSQRANNAVGSVVSVRGVHDADVLSAPEPLPIPPGNEVTVPDNKDDKGRYKCNYCEKTFSSRQSKSLHTKAAHYGERPYLCRECGATFAYPRSLKLHAATHRRTDASMGFACDLCGKVLNHPSSVVYHKEAAHANHRYVCNKCGKTFKHKQLLQRHQLVHSQLRPYTCKTCNASFKTKANLLNHQLLHSGIKKFTCEICKHKFAHKTSLTLHLRWHSGLKPFSCAECGKSFSQKGNLSEHERIHTGEKPFECAVCARRFTTSSQHALHARRHAPDKPYACAQPHCGKRFASRNAWQAHARRESGVSSARTHRCTVCARGFPERWALRKHMRRHTGERPFRCPHCPRAFSDCSNLNKHKKQIHKQVNQQVSLLVNDRNQTQQLQQQLNETQQTQLQQLNETQQIVQQSPPNMKSHPEDELEESVIYVTYDVDDSNAFHILDPEQAASLESSSKVVTTCSLYSGSPLEPPSLEQRPELVEQLVAPYELHATHVPVTDEQGNPLHFTMQDGTRLAITSVDGKSLQVITQDGQTIPVEINGYADEEVVESGDTIVHQLNLQKSVEGSPVTHYYTIV